MSDLHQRCLDAIAKRREVVGKSTPGPWETYGESKTLIRARGMSVCSIDEDDYDAVDDPFVLPWDDTAVIVAAVNSLDATTDALASIIERHADAGESQGYTGTGYDYIEHCCGTCGTFGEYGHPWPCADYLDAAKALGVDVTP